MGAGATPAGCRLPTSRSVIHDGGMRGPLRGARWLHSAAWTVAVLCLAVLAFAAIMRSTVLNAGFYGKVVEEERAYERLYDEVLVAPQSSALTRDLLARLPGKACQPVRCWQVTQYRVKGRTSSCAAWKGWAQFRHVP